MLSVTIEATDLGECISSVFAKIQDPNFQEEVLDEALSILLNRIRQRFLSEVDPDGVPWIPSKAGLRRKSGGYTYRNGGKYTGTGTLFETGTLFHSIQGIRGPTPFSRVISTDVPYARELQEEATHGGTWVFLGFGQDDMYVFEKLVIKRVKEALK